MNQTAKNAAKAQEVALEMLGNGGYQPTQGVDESNPPGKDKARFSKTFFLSPDNGNDVEMWQIEYSVSPGEKITEIMDIKELTAFLRGYHIGSQN